jgi:hypothetical protein
MSVEKDPLLVQLFQEGDQDLVDIDDIKRILERIDREQRKQRVLMVAAFIGFTLVAALVEPLVTQALSVIAQVLTAVGMESLSPLPRLGWLAGGASVIAASPLLYLWRTSRW